MEGREDGLSNEPVFPQPPCLSLNTQPQRRTWSSCEWNMPCSWIRLILGLGLLVVVVSKKHLITPFCSSSTTQFWFTLEISAIVCKFWVLRPFEIWPVRLLMPRCKKLVRVETKGRRSFRFWEVATPSFHDSNGERVERVALRALRVAVPHKRYRIKHTNWTTAKTWTQFPALLYFKKQTHQIRNTTASVTVNSTQSQVVN